MRTASPSELRGHTAAIEPDESGSPWMNEHPTNKTSRIGTVAVLAAVAAGLVGLVVMRLVLGTGSLALEAAYQLASAMLALGVVGLTRRFVPDSARRYLAVGELGAAARPVRWLGIKGRESWWRLGVTFAVVITVVTTAVVYTTSDTRPVGLPALAFALLLAVPFAAVNAAVEELMTRYGIVAALDGNTRPGVIALASGAFFGIAHYWGTPGGPLGVLLAGFLGWFLAKSVLETRGLGWAWFIHFLQDVAIFGALFLALTR